MASAEKFWDKVASGYSKSPIKDMAAYEKTMERTRAYLATDDAVLELGCGTGSTAILLSEAVGHITATDISGAMIDIANGKIADRPDANITFRKGAPDDLPFEPGSFDAVLAYNFFHLLDEAAQENTMRRTHDWLKPGGYLISKSACLANASALMRAAMTVMIPAMRLVGRAPYVNFMSIDDLETRITRSGFEILETGDYPASPPSHFVVARKL